MTHEPIYLTEEQLAEIAALEANILALENSGQLQIIIDAGIAAIKNDIVAIQESAPAGAPKTPCPTCNPHSHCATCSNPIDSKGNTTLDGIAYLPEEPDSDA